MYAAVDIGGTKTLVAVFDDQANIIESDKFSTPQNYEEFLTNLADAVGQLTTKQFRAVGVGMPGLIDRTTGTSSTAGPNLHWLNSPVKSDTERLFNCRSVVENDANLAGLSEALLVRQQYRKVAYLTISTGIGGVYVIDGSIDSNTIEAEVGHMIFEHEGSYQIWEQFASGKAIVAKYGKKASEIEDEATWEAISKNIALGIINISAVLTPDVIIIGGGVGAHLPKFIEPLDKIIADIKSPVVTVPPILQAQRPEEAVIYGCYEVAKGLTDAVPA